jgi:hypothetical protein
MLVCPASESGGGAAAEAAKYRVQGVWGDTKRRHVCERDAGGLLVWEKSVEMLLDFGGDGCEGEVLQAACSKADVAGLQEGMHAGGKRAVRGRWVATLSANAVGCVAGGLMIFGMACFRQCSLKSREDATVLPFAWAHCEAGIGEPELGSHCVCLAVRLGGVRNPGEMQLDGPLPCIVKRLRCAGLWLAGGRRLRRPGHCAVDVDSHTRM